MKVRQYRQNIRMVAAAIVFPVIVTACSGDVENEEENVNRYRLTTGFLGEQQGLASVPTAEGEIGLAFSDDDNGSPSGEWLIESENGAYRISNREAGADRSLDSVNDGVFDQLELAPSSDVSGQRWQITPLENGFCRLTNEFLGAEIALDVTPDTLSPEPTMRSVADVSGQHWRLTQLGRGDSTLDDLCTGEALD